MRVGIIGSGTMAEVHATAWDELGAELRFHSRHGAAQLAARHRAVEESDLEGLLRWAEIVDICTPTPTHRDFALRAVTAGANVVCEKPLARTAADARAIATAASTAGVLVYPAHVVRYFPDYVRLRRAIAQGDLGQLTTLEFTRGGAAPASDWFFRSELSGGLVMDLLIHDLDQARWLAGPVTRVEASQDPPSQDGMLPRVVRAEVTLTHESGAHSRIRGEWGPPGLPFRTSFTATGTRGSLSSRPDAGPDGTPEGDPYRDQLAEFAAAFAGGPAPRVSLADGVVAVALAEAAERSIESGRPAPFDERRALGGA